MMASGVGQPEATDQLSGLSLLNRMVGDSNMTEVYLQGTSHQALIDSGSMVTTMSKSCYDNLTHKPSLFTLDKLGLQVSLADGSNLEYLGYVECCISVPFLSDVEFNVPVLVVPDSKLNDMCDIIIGTNVIRLYTKHVNQTDQNIPDAWRLALASIKCKVYSVKAANKQVLEIGPYQSAVVNGTVRGLDHDVKEIVTENLDNQYNYIVCPRVLKVHNTNIAKIQVKICNISAKPISIKPRSEICQVNEVKVIHDLADSNFDMADHSKTESPILSDVNELGVDVNTSVLNPSQMTKVNKLLTKWKHIFSTSPLDLGNTDIVKHKIELENTKPFKQPYRKIPPAMYEEVRQHIKEMLDAGVIRESNSPFSSNLVLVRKRDGSLRICLDFRMLNSRTRKDAYMLPRFDDIIDTVSGSKYFSKLDLRSGYWQVEIEEADKHKTAFSVGNLGFYECSRMGMGLTNAPSTFQRLMEKCMGEMLLKEVLIFLDDILIFADTFEQHIERLESVFFRLAQHNLKLKPSKCELFKTSITYLGHVISEKGISTDPEKTLAVENWPPPQNVKELRQFLGFVGYYRRFVKNYSKIVQPLNALLIGHSTNKSFKQSKSKQKSSWIWGESQQTAFENVKQKLTEPPILAYADYSLPFILHTDASSVGLGAVLYQKQNGVERVIAYASRGLRPSERNYPAHKLEFLALKWAVCDKFHDYLYGNIFDVVTDNNPLTYILSKAKLDATSHRWVASLATYNFTLSYRPGKLNSDGDGLSRKPQVFTEAVKAICEAVLVSVPLAACVSQDCISHTADEETITGENLNSINWQTEQSKDMALRRVVDLVRSDFRPRGKGLARESLSVQKYLREWSRLQLDGDILYRIASLDGHQVKQLVLPESYHQLALKLVHDDTGHQGKEKTLWLAKQRFYWPGLENDVNQKVEYCGRCIRRKKPVRPAAELVPINTTRPMELVCIDFLTLEKSKGGYEHILVITDHFTRYSQAIPCRNQLAHTTAKALYENFILFYSFPEKLHSDQGRNFESKVIKELCKLANVQKTRTTPYHPMGNGSAERFNQTLLKMLGTLEEDKKADWKSYVAPLVQAYNATKNEATGYSPHYLMFGWHPRLSVDAYLGLDPDNDGKVSHETYVEKLRGRLRYAYESAAKEASKLAARNKVRYDSKVRDSVIEVGDRVLVRKVGLQGKQKLADKWDQQPYLVIHKPNSDIPVYKVKPEFGKGPSRTLHRNMLLPFNVMPSEETDFTIQPQQDKPAKPAKPRTANKLTEISESESTDSDEDWSRYARYIIPQRRTNVKHMPSPVSPPKTTNSVNVSESLISNNLVDLNNTGNNVTNIEISQNTTTNTDVSVNNSTISNMQNNGVVTENSGLHLRRSQRPRKPPDRLGEWITSQLVIDGECFV